MSGAKAIRVLLADDQRVVREGLATLLGLLPAVDVVGTASDGEEVVKLAAELAPEVVLMDLRMPRCDGVEATRRLRELDPESKVIVLTTYADDRSVVDALRAGARGYLTKDAGAEEIEQAIAAVARGEAAIDPAVQHHLVEAVAAGGRSEESRPAPSLPDGLTPREATASRASSAGAMMSISSRPKRPPSPPCGLSAATAMRGVAKPAARIVASASVNAASMRAGVS